MQSFPSTGLKSRSLVPAPSLAHLVSQCSIWGCEKNLVWEWQGLCLPLGEGRNCSSLGQSVNGVHGELYPARLVSSGLQMSQLASFCGQGQPFRTNRGQCTLFCFIATGCIWPQVFKSANLLRWGDNTLLLEGWW